MRKTTLLLLLFSQFTYAQFLNVKFTFTKCELNNKDLKFYNKEVIKQIQSNDSVVFALGENPDKDKLICKMKLQKGSGLNGVYYLTSMTFYVIDRNGLSDEDSSGRPQKTTLTKDKPRMNFYDNRIAYGPFVGNDFDLTHYSFDLDGSLLSYEGSSEATLDSFKVNLIFPHLEINSVSVLTGTYHLTACNKPRVIQITVYNHKPVWLSYSLFQTVLHGYKQPYIKADLIFNNKQNQPDTIPILDNIAYLDEIKVVSLCDTKDKPANNLSNRVWMSYRLKEEK